MEGIYLDTNQLYFIRKIAEEADGFDYGNYEWACRLFPDNPDLVDDIRALCFIVALQYEWELDFLPSNASFAELSLSSGVRAEATRNAWMVFAEFRRPSFQATDATRIKHGKNCGSVFLLCSIRGRCHHFQRRGNVAKYSSPRRKLL